MAQYFATEFIGTSENRWNPKVSKNDEILFEEEKQISFFKNHM